MYCGRYNDNYQIENYTSSSNVHNSYVNYIIHGVHNNFTSNNHLSVNGKVCNGISRKCKYILCTYTYCTVYNSNYCALCNNVFGYNTERI